MKRTMLDAKVKLNDETLHIFDIRWNKIDLHLPSEYFILRDNLPGELGTNIYEIMDYVAIEHDFNIKSYSIIK